MLCQCLYVYETFYVSSYRRPPVRTRDLDANMPKSRGRSTKLRVRADRTLSPCFILTVDEMYEINGDISVREVTETET